MFKTSSPIRTAEDVYKNECLLLTLREKKENLFFKIDYFRTILSKKSKSRICFFEVG